MNEVAKIQQAVAMPAAANPSMTRAIDVALSGAVTRNGETVLLPGKEIAPEARRMAEARLSTLSRCLDARSHADLVTAIGRMLAGYPSVRQSGDDARTLLLAYVSMVEDFAPWAVTEAVRRWQTTATGEGRTLAFPPSAAELREACQSVVWRYQAERGKLKQALTAKTQPIPKDEHSRVSAGLDDFRAELAASVNRKTDMTPSQARAALEARCAELGVDPKVIDDIRDQPVTARHVSEGAAKAIETMANSMKLGGVGDGIAN